MTEEQQPFEEEAPEAPEVLPEVPEEEVIPEPPPLKREKKDLKERVTCSDCGQYPGQLSQEMQVLSQPGEVSRALTGSH